MSKISNNPKRFIKRSDLITGGKHSYSEKIKKMKLKKTVEFVNEKIDKSGYSFLK